MSRNIYLSLAVFALLPLAGGTASAQSSFIHQAENPFDNNSDGLPDLGMAPESRAGEKHFAEMVKAFGEASMTDNGLDTGEQAKQFAFGQVRDRVSEQVNQQLESWLSPWGNASVGLQVDNEGSFTGSRGSWFIPWQDNQRYLTWSQLGLTQQDGGLFSNAGIGQRWVRDGWLLGYNTFYDNLLDENLPRGGVGAEAWGEYLRLSANYYQPLSSWQGRFCNSRTTDGPGIRPDRANAHAILSTSQYQRQRGAVFWRPGGSVSFRNWVPQSCGGESGIELYAGAADHRDSTA
ncbi:Invasin [Citrobacter freundii]|uniref:Invasin n=1 Tax=Citrobacter freundii TaxID=546 RepID=A0A7G2IXL1_CITFR|nr:Invasin [Citrobacter freundii]